MSLDMPKYETASIGREEITVVMAAEAMAWGLRLLTSGGLIYHQISQYEMLHTHMGNTLIYKALILELERADDFG